MLTSYELIIGNDRFDVLVTPVGGLLINKRTCDVLDFTPDELEYVLSIKGNG